MQRVTITIDDELDAELDRFIKARGYANRSEAIRDLARTGLQQASVETGGPGQCVAALVYLYDHEARDLPKRLTRDFHHRHDLAQTTLHVHLDHDSCMEVTILRGATEKVASFLMSLAQRVYCLAHGELLAEGSPERIIENSDVINAYLGAQ